MLILAKGAPSQIETKMKYGFPNIEIHLVDRVTDRDTEFVDAAIDKGANVVVVHTPLFKLNGCLYGTSLRNMMSFDICTDYLRDSFVLARRCALKQRHPVYVLIHNGITDTETMLFPDAIMTIVGRIASLSKIYHCPVLIENESSKLGTPDCRVSICEPCTPIAQINVLRMFESYGVPAEAVVDTCHVLIDNEWSNRCLETTNEVDWNAYFKAFVDAGCSVGLIHLSNMHGNGMGKGHGCPFTKDDDERLRRILEARRMYANDSIVTVEVGEEDYMSVPKNLITTVESIRRIQNAK